MQQCLLHGVVHIERQLAARDVRFSQITRHLAYFLRKKRFSLTQVFFGRRDGGARLRQPRPDLRHIPLRHSTALGPGLDHAENFEMSIHIAARDLQQLALTQDVQKSLD